MENTIKDGFSACAGATGSEWYGGVLVLEGKDRDFLSVAEELSYEQRADHARRWAELTVNPRRQIALVQPVATGMEARYIAAAERIEGPVAPGEPVDSPVLAWIQRRAGQWHLMVYRNDEVTTVLSRRNVIRCPQVTMTADGLLFAFESDTGPFTTQVEVVGRRGVTLYKTAGRAPLLRSADDGYALSTEQSAADSVTVRLAFFTGDHTDKPTQTLDLKEGDYLFSAAMAWSDESHAVVIAAESSPRFGYGCQIGLHRTIHTWQWSPGNEAVSLGLLPVEQRAFKSIGVENMAPIKPFVLIDHGKPVVVFKQHRFTGFRGFGWDLLWCRIEADEWTEPARLSPATTTSDASFGLVCLGNRYIGLFPAHENEGGSGSKQSENHRVDLVSFDRNRRLDSFEIPADKTGDYRIPAACKSVASDPAPLANPYEGRRLIWGDLHIHTIYSKCVSAVDGDPREKIRFAREVLGCRVFAIAEHTPFTTGSESTWLYDQLEVASGQDNVILYATEPGITGTRHMNLYSRDRETFEKLERIIIAQDHRYPEILRQIREDLPHDAVFVMRHVHGRGIPDAQILQHFDPRVEVAMEAMQGRGNAMLGVVEKSPIFPNAFLDAGCKIGLVGGTDHFREWAPNHFCLTGFWVKEISADGVWEAIRNRYTIAMSDSRVAMMTACKGMPMGETITLEADEPVRVTVQASCARRIRRMTLMRDGELLPWTDLDSTHATIDLVDDEAGPGRHWYVVTAEVDTGHGGDNVGICHASPYFVWKRDN